MAKLFKCAACGDVITSRHTHDFRKCKCGAIFVDGGDAYTRLGWPSGPIEKAILVEDSMRGWVPHPSRPVVGDS